MPPAIEKLQALRDRLSKALIVRSGYRSPSHNRAVGGASASKHMLGTAFDIAMSNHDPAIFAEAARAVGFLGFGTYPRSGFMHIDLGPARSWGEPLPTRATPFVSEVPPAREVLADSRTLKGGGAAGIVPSVRPVLRSHRMSSRKPSPPYCPWCPTSTPCAGCSSPSR